MASACGLVADIGATNARFALVDPTGVIGRVCAYRMADFSNMAGVLDAFLRDTDVQPQNAALAVAAPVTGDVVSFTNRAWSFSISELKRRYGFQRLLVINDFAANALAVPRLTKRDRMQIGPGVPVAEAPFGIIGPGTGLGVSAMAPASGGFSLIQGEGGHVSMPGANEREDAVIGRVRQLYGHASAERLLSGPGLVNIYEALCALADVAPAALSPADITDPDSTDVRAREATEMFCAMLGTVAGNLALTLGARAGIYIAGGIVPRLCGRFASSGFRERFEAKGRFTRYQAVIPTYVIVRPFPALLGAAILLSQEGFSSDCR